MSSTRSYAEPRWFYCHQCTNRWLKSHNSIFECPRCRQGFIEEVTDEFNPNIPFFPSPPSPLRYILYDAFNETNEEDARSRNRARRNRTDRTEQANNNNRQPSTSRSRSPHISNIVIGTGGNRDGANRTDQNFRIIFNTRQGEANRFLSVAIDDIMNSLFTSERQPAMTDEQLNEIPLATITAEQVEAQLQCAICFEDYEVNENEVRKLLCNHFFHEKCIFPWLRNNASCPVCRTSLASENDSDEEVANFVQFITNNRRARMNQNNADNEPGPSTSQPNRSVPQASTSQPGRVSGSQLSRIPRLSRRVENPQVNPIASTRIRSRNLQINQNEPAPHLRQQNMTIRGDVSSRVNAPISSRTRSHQNLNLLETRNPQNSREHLRNGGQRNGLSRIRHIQSRPQHSALTHSDNNIDEPPQPQRSRRRRIPFYSPPPLTVRNNQRSFVNYQELLRRIEDDSDSSSSRDTVGSTPYSVSDPEIIQISPVNVSIPRINTERGTAAEPLRVDISDDSD